LNTTTDANQQRRDIGEKIVKRFIKTDGKDLADDSIVTQVGDIIAHLCHYVKSRDDNPDVSICLGYGHYMTEEYEESSMYDVNITAVPVLPEIAMQDCKKIAAIDWTVRLFVGYDDSIANDFVDDGMELELDNYVSRLPRFISIGDETVRVVDLEFKSARNLL